MLGAVLYIVFIDRAGQVYPYRSFPVAGVYQYRYRAVVQQLHLHVGAEYSRRDFSAEILFERGNESLIKWNGDGFFRRADVGRAVAFTGRCVQGKLADDHYFAIDLFYVQIHHPFRVVEYPQLAAFLREPFDIFHSVGILDAYKYEHPFAYTGMELSPDGYGGVFYALYDQSHDLIILGSLF